jgi:hypothetical protein
MMHERVARWRQACAINRHAKGQLGSVRCLVLILLIYQGLLPLLAFASPPGPVWIPGIYDLADYDDVIVVLTDIDAVDNSSPATLPAAPVGERALARAAALALCNSSFLSYGPRSLPAI